MCTQCFHERRLCACREHCRGCTHNQASCTLYRTGRTTGSIHRRTLGCPRRISSGARHRSLCCTDQTGSRICHGSLCCTGRTSSSARHLCIPHHAPGSIGRTTRSVSTLGGKCCHRRLACRYFYFKRPPAAPASPVTAPAAPATQLHSRRKTEVCIAMEKPVTYWRPYATVQQSIANRTRIQLLGYRWSLTLSPNPCPVTGSPLVTKPSTVAFGPHSVVLMASFASLSAWPMPKRTSSPGKGGQLPIDASSQSVGQPISQSVPTVSQ